MLKHPGEFDWPRPSFINFIKENRGYGVLSFGDKNLPTVIAYAQNQKEHHRQQTTHEAMEKWSEEEDGVVVYLEGS